MRLCLFLLVFVTSCATGEKFHLGKAVEAPQTRLFVYRMPRFLGSLGQPRILLDGKEVCRHTNSGFAEFVLDPGPHSLEFIRTGEEKPEGHLDLSLVSGQDQFVKFDLLKEDGPWKAEFKLVDSEHALPEIKQTRRVYP